MTRPTSTSLCLFLLFIFTSQYLQAQILFGPKVGYQASMLRYAKLYDGTDYTEGLGLSPQIGAVYSFKVSKGIAFYSELYYSQRSKSEKTTEVTTLMRNHQANYHFLDVPLMLRFTHPLSKGKKAPSAYINAGPHIAYWLAGQGKLESMESFGSSNRISTEYTIRFTDSEQQEATLFAEDANRLQFGLSAGTGLLIPVNDQGHLLQIDFRYTLGSTFMGSNLDLPIGTTGVEENFSFGYSVISASVAYTLYLDVWGMRKGKSTKRR